MSSASTFDVERAREEYRQGRSLRDVAKEMGCSHVHLWRVLMERGEPIRPRSSSTQSKKMVRGRKQLAALQASHAVLLYSAGVPVEEVAYSLRHTTEWVHAKLKEAGIASKGKP